MKWHNIEHYVAIRCGECNEFRFLSDFPEKHEHVCFTCLLKRQLAVPRLDITIQPRQLPVTGCGTLWEFALLNKGFNELPGIKQYGVIVNYWNNGEVEIYWPHIDITTFVFPDEIRYPRRGV